MSYHLNDRKSEQERQDALETVEVLRTEKFVSKFFAPYSDLGGIIFA
jgi:hypothetical protein